MEIKFAYERCLNVTEMSMHGTHFELILQRYVVPVLAMFGILGNALNLTVLLNMRTRSNTFLAVLAFADIIFLLLLFPNVLANIPILTNNFNFRYLYYVLKFHLLSVGNWCSAITIWCVIAVCTERLIGIRRPLYVRDEWSWWKMPLIIGTIIVVTGILTAYQHFQHDCMSGSFCNGTQLYQRCLKVTDEKWFGNRTNPYSQSFRTFISLSVHVYIDLMILFPIFLLSILNFMLICALRQRRRNMSSLDDSLRATVTTANSGVYGLRKTRPSADSTMMRTEHRVTLTVTIIVTAFTLTNGPSAVLQLIRSTYSIHERSGYNLTMVCNILVILGKASNFILFCLSSRHFRDRLISTLVNKKFSTVSYYKTTERNNVGEASPSKAALKSVRGCLSRLLPQLFNSSKLPPAPKELRVNLIEPEKRPSVSKASGASRQ